MSGGWFGGFCFGEGGVGVGCGRVRGVWLRASSDDLVAYAAPRGTAGPGGVGNPFGEFGKWAFGCGRALGSGRQRLTWSRMQLRGARQSLMTSESDWEFGKWALCSGRARRTSVARIRGAARAQGAPGSQRRG